MRRILIALLTVFVLTGLLPSRRDAQTRGIRRGDTALPDGVAAKDVSFYSEGIECHGKIFTPKGFSAEGSAPAVALAPDRGATAASIERYAAHFASRGLVAMVIDYRGWGKSGGFPQTVDEVKTDDRLRFSQMTARVRIRRKRLIPREQILDIRNARYYLQGEPGVDRARVGVWGAGMAGGHLIVIAENDASVNNEINAMAASKLLKGPTEVTRVPGVTHAQIDSGVAFETAANAAAEWFLKYL